MTNEDFARLVEFEKNAGNSVKKRSVFSVDTNVFFKHTSVVRFMDQQKKVVIYMSYARELIDGSPKSSVSVVPLIIVP